MLTTLLRFLEFKEIRKEWKARKKEEEAARKAEEERQRQAVAVATAAQNGNGEGPPGPETSQPPATYPGRQLPPLGYQGGGQYPAPPSAGVQQPEYNNSYMAHGNYQPASPYGAPNQQIYSQRKCHSYLGLSPA